MRDFLLTGKGDDGLATEEEHNAMLRASYLKQKQNFLEALTAEEKRRLDADSALEGLSNVSRRANKDWLVHSDNMLIQTCGFGLARFRPGRRATPLMPGDRRYLAAVPRPGGGELEMRSCLALSDGSQVFETPRVFEGGERQRPTIHLCSDQGSIGVGALVWLKQRYGARCTVAFDPLHRIHNDAIDAASQSNLVVLKLEMLQVTRMRRGPFDAQGNWGVLRGAAQEIMRQRARTCCGFSCYMTTSSIATLPCPHWAA